MCFSCIVVQFDIKRNSSAGCCGTQWGEWTMLRTDQCELKERNSTIEHWRFFFHLAVLTHFLFEICFTANSFIFDTKFYWDIKVVEPKVCFGCVFSVYPLLMLSSGLNKWLDECCVWSVITYSTNQTQQANTSLWHWYFKREWQKCYKKSLSIPNNPRINWDIFIYFYMK